jgi:tetratricopeptide (TPR) repeat protein
MDELMRLIRSLSKSEKRYFKMFSSLQGGDKDYIKLFEAVEKIGEYDEEKIKKLLKGEDFLKRLPAVKNYLYGQLLKSLRMNYIGTTIDSELKEMAEEITILYDKRLFKQAIKILEKAKDLAKANEQTLQLVELNILEGKILIEVLNLDKFEKTLSSSLEEEIKLLEIQKNAAEYRDLYNRIILINKKIKEARTEQELKQFEEIIVHPLLRSFSSARSFDAKNYYYLIHLNYNHAKGDNEACLQIAQKQLELLESFPQKISEKPKMYIAALNNVLLSQIHLHSYKNFDKTLEKLRSIPLKSVNIEANRFVSSYIFEMVMYLDTGEFTKSVTIRENVLEGLKKYHDKINAIEEITLLYNLFYSYFGTGEFSKALGIINKLLNEYQKELRYDIQSAVRILNLILHYELGNSRLLEYNAVSAYRFLYKSKRLYKLENIVLNYIRKKMHHIYTPKDEVEAFIELRREFMELIDDPYEKKAFEYFDYISWFDSRIEKRSFEEIVKEKYLQKNNKSR